jgi:acetylornithine deacetylase/succinyl-diaminopimelate desuccinylase-like protein
MTYLRGLLFLSSCLAASAADSVHLDFRTVSRDLVQRRLESVTADGARRQAVLETLFGEAGCDTGRIARQPVPRFKADNVICTLPGEGPGTIVVGGHIDHVARGMGAVDDWSGAALLPSLFQTLDGKPRRHRFVFVGFAAEENGLQGSKEFVRRLSAEERQSIRAMVNLECLGMTPPKVWGSRADKALLQAYVNVAGTVGQSPASVNVERIGDDDSHPFLDLGIPVITFHSVTQDTLPILHSVHDSLSAINPEHYYAAYRVASVYLAYLDATLEP